MKKLLLLLMLISLPVSAQDIIDKGLQSDMDFTINMTCHSRNKIIKMPNRQDSELCIQAINAKLQVHILEELEKLNKINSINPSTD